VGGVTFADSVLHLVRAGARIDSGGDPGASAIAHGLAAEPLASEAVASVAVASAAEPSDFDAGYESFLQPGFADIEAAVALVETGLATRVTLTGFRSWPGLLWQAYQLVESTDVVILPTVVRPGGRVDIVISRGSTADG
jgi:hypothetical protein